MNFVVLEIDKIAIHQVFVREDSQVPVKPVKGKELIRFDQHAMSDFKRRVLDSLANGSSAVRMMISDHNEGRTPSIINRLHGLSDKDFIDESYHIAERLAEAQKRKNISGGIVVVFSATYNPKKLKFVGIIKADIHSAYQKAVDPETNEISLTYVKEVLLTPSTRLYKSAGFFMREDAAETEDLNTQWLVDISDYQIDKSDGKAAAQYFYQDFLGCAYPSTSARRTKEYFELTSSFISRMKISEEDRNDLHNALYSDLKAKRSERVSPLEFANEYMSDIDVDNFREYLENANFAVEPFIKNIEHLTGKLKSRRVKFSRDIRITAPSDVFKELVEIETFQGEAQDDGAKPTWTKILIKDRIIKQE
ncbi:nucleoid-associated protein [Serratia sp. NPDC087055]|jgi:nucleoid-associated protein YejK|uniref:nucleoid-associated protein n=1 Tax=Serratia sp. NPDC087055 TaxID=3364516 RepID=UPI00384EDC88